MKNNTEEMLKEMKELLEALKESKFLNCVATDKCQICFEIRGKNSDE